MPDVHVPGIGNVPRAGVIAGVVIGGAGGLYLYVKHKDSKASTASTASTAAYGYGYGAYGYGSYGYSNPAFNEPYIGGEYGYGGAYGYGIGEGYGVGSPTPPPTQLATTNAAWAQAAENYLTETGGYDAGTVAAALGIYITGSTLSAAQQAVVEAAIAFEGYPPNPGASGYPPAMHTSASTGQGGGSGSGSGGGGTGAKTITVPNVQGKRVMTAVAQLKALGLKAGLNSAFNKNALNYVSSQTPGAGTKVASGTKVDLNSTQTKPK